jgi:hypothetical protein
MRKFFLHSKMLVDIYKRIWVTINFFYTPPTESIKLNLVPYKSRILFMLHGMSILIVALFLFGVYISFIEQNI